MLYLSCMGTKEGGAIKKIYGLLIDPKFIRTINKKHKDRIHTFSLEWNGANKIVLSGSLKYYTKQGEPSVKFIVHECTWTTRWGLTTNKVETRWITKTNRNKNRVSAAMSSHVNNHIRDSIKHFGAQKWAISQVSWDWSGAIEQPREQSVTE